MAKAPIAMSKIKQILRQRAQGGSRKSISRHTGVSLRTVKKYVNAAEGCDAGLEALLELEEWELLERLFPCTEVADERLAVLEEEFGPMERELRKVGVTRQLLWHRYKQAHPEGYNYSRFCHYFRRWRKRQDVSMHLEHRAGDKLFVDYAGKKLKVRLLSSGQEVELEMFVGILPASGYTYAEAVESQQKEDLIDTSQNCLHYFGGVPKAIVPDNLKSAVTTANRYEPTINQAFEEFANHYQMSVLPARAARPKDKALVENAVRLVYQRIYALLPEGPFHSIDDVNAAIRILLDAHNRALFQGGEDCRLDRFMALDQPELAPLPTERYSIKRHNRVTVQKNSHVLLSIDRHYYSVPYRFIGKKVKLSWDKRVVEVYYNRKRIAFHRRNIKRFSYTSTPDHLPSKHQHYNDRSPGYYLNKALEAGPQVVELFKAIFERRAHPEHAYKSCQGILSLQRSYGKDRLCKAAGRALFYSCYSYKCVKDILEKGLDQQTERPQPDKADSQIGDHENIRGKEYYQ